MHPKKRLRHLIFLATASLSLISMVTHKAVAETKVKPDLPLDEEIYEPPKAQATKKANSDKSAHDKPAHDNPTHGNPAHETPPAAPSADHSPTTHGGAVQEEEHFEPTHTENNHEASPTTPKLLEGKVQPTPAAKGSGMVWFVVIFVLLAAAIFIFT